MRAWGNSAFPNSFVNHQKMVEAAGVESSSNLARFCAMPRNPASLLIVIRFLHFYILRQSCTITHESEVFFSRCFPLRRRGRGGPTPSRERYGAIGFTRGTFLANGPHLPGLVSTGFHLAALIAPQTAVRAVKRNNPFHPFTCFVPRSLLFHCIRITEQLE